MDILLEKIKGETSLKVSPLHPLRGVKRKLTFLFCSVSLFGNISPNFSS